MSYLPNLIAQTADFIPGYNPVLNATPGQIARDDNGSMHIRGQVLTDEGGYRCNFANSSLAVNIGTCTFTNGSDTVAWTYTDLMDIHVGDYVYLTADTVTQSQQVASIDTTTITLEEVYTGTGGTGAGSRQILNSKVGTGGTITVASGTGVITAGTTAGSIFELERSADVMPIKKYTGFTISQRIANQDIYVGFYGESYTPTNVFAWFHFSGTDNTLVMCKTGKNPTGAPSASETETFTVKIPNGGTTATSHRYTVTIQKNKVSFWIDDIRVAQCFKVTPRAPDFLTSTIQVVNGTTPATSTTVTVDYDACVNDNSLAVDYFSDDTSAQAPNIPMIDTTYTQAGVIPINTDLVLLDCTQLRSVIIQCTSMGTAGVVTPYFSSDNGATYVASNFVTTGGVATTTFNAVGMWVIPVTGRLLRLRLTTATTAGTTTIYVNGLQQHALTPVSIIGTTVVSGSVTATGIAGAGASAATISGNPVRIGARAMSTNAVVATGQTADMITTLAGSIVNKPYSIPELDFGVPDTITNSTTAVQIKALTASNKNYVTALTIQSATLSGSTILQLRDTPIASSTATIASNTLVMAGTYNWKVGDLVYVTASTVVGLTASNYYYILTVSGANLTFSATRGGSVLAISGTSVVATLAHVIYRTTLATTALPLTVIKFINPLSTGTGLALEVATITAVTGAIDINVSGYTAR